MAYRRPLQTLSMAVALAIAFLAVATPNMAHAQTYNVIYTFRFFLDGAQPYSGVTVKSDTLYGSTHNGNEGTNWGDVYQVRHRGSTWFYTVLQLFDGTLMQRPVFGPDGVLYGSSPNNISMMIWGYVYALHPSVHAYCPTIRCPWDVSFPYSFQNGPDGSVPRFGELIFDHAGNIYGTASSGGVNGNGVVWRLRKTGSSWIYDVLYSFTGNPDGAQPFSALTFDSAGNLYGTTMLGGTHNFGTVFKLTPNGDTWTETVLYNFTNGTDGSLPAAGLLIDAAGNLYGETTSGGAGGAGNVYMMTPAGGGYNFSVVKAFTGAATCGPYEKLSTDSSGNLYGTTYCSGNFNFGNVFKLTRVGQDFTYSSLYDFTGGTDGKLPYSDVAFDSQGNLYGTASKGGNENSGVIWQIVP